MSFDPSNRYLEIHWRNKRVVAYCPVPEEIVRRLCNAPNPATYFEDRIAEEYPKVEPKKEPTD
ncbi:MAG: KTSC domain-containing protein [Burkholderiaceae bacterium]